MANPYKGEDTQLAVGVETSQGSTATPTQVFGKVAEEAQPPDPEQEWMVQHVIGGGGREAFQQEQGIKEYQGGDIPIVLQDGHPVAYVLGKDSVSGTAAPYTHTLTAQNNSAPPTQTIEATYYNRGGGGDFVRTFSGCVPNSAELSMNEDDELTCSLEYWAMGVSTSTTPTTGISVPSTDPWLFADSSSQLTLFGTAFARFQEFTLSIENNLQEGRYIAPDTAHPTGDGRDPYEILYGNAEYELTATIVVSDPSVYNELTAPTAGGFNAVIEFQRGGTGDLFKIEAIDCQISESDHPMPAEAEPAEVEVTMQPMSLKVTVESDDSSAWV